MRESYLLVAAAVIILAVLVVVGLALSSSQPATALQVSHVSTATVISGCPPRPTRTPVVATTLRDTPMPPTPAPTATPGPPRIETPVPDATLIHPLENQEEILKVVLDVDMGLADWDDPWCLETPRLQPGRITIKWYPNMNAYDGQGALNYGDDDPRWVVTIKGAVWLHMPGFRSKSGGAVYFVNPKTGKIYRIGGLATP